MQGWQRELPLQSSCFDVVMCHSERGSWVVILQADLESLLQSPSGNALNFNKATALHAFGLYCRLSVHLQYTVGCLVLVLRASCVRAAFVTYWLLCCVGQFCSEEKIHLSILNETGSWLENKVLPLLQDQEEEYLKLRSDVYQQVIQVSSWGTAGAVFSRLLILL